jgi:UDPglucose 6-dehydrogenase
MQISIIGTGYVGLVTAACLAEMGHTVTCLDIDEKKINNLHEGIIPIYEPGLSELVKRNIKANRLFFTTSYTYAIESSDVCFIAVPTPSSEDGSCDLSYVLKAAESIAKCMTKPMIIVNKSTAPVGTCDKIEEKIQAHIKNDLTFDVVSNPEFLKEGSAIHDCMKPDRIVIGANSEKAAAVMKKIYAPFTLNHDRILIMDRKSSEMTKYAANAMLATRISFMNEISRICEKVGADVNEVRKGIGSDTRIGYSFLYPGIGYGGSCFPKDTDALRFLAKENGCTPLLLDAVHAVNVQQKKVLTEKIAKYFDAKGGLKGKTIAIWGLSFKPDTDDMREAPSVTIIKDLSEKGAILRLYDPIAMDNAKKLLENHQNLTWCTSEAEAAEGSDAIALLTEWKQFRLINFKPIQDTMKGTAFFDGRNQYKPEEMKNFDYIGIGVPDHILKNDIH